MANAASGGDLALSVFERIPALDGSNYRSWSFSMKMLLKARELWDVIEDETPKDRTRESTSEGTPEAPPPQRDAAWRRKDQLALSSIVLSLKPAEQDQVYDCQTAKEAWTHLQEVYKGKGMHRLLSLLKQLSSAQPEKNATSPPGSNTIKDYIRNMIYNFRKETMPNIYRPPSIQDIRSRQNFTAAIVIGMDIQMTIVLRNQATFAVNFVVDLVITKMSVVQEFIIREKNLITRRTVVTMKPSEGLPFTVQDSSLECPSRGSIRYLIYLIWKTLHHHGIFGSNARGGVLEYVDHCFEHYGLLIFSLSFALGI